MLSTLLVFFSLSSTSEKRFNTRLRSDWKPDSCWSLRRDVLTVSMVVVQEENLLCVEELPLPCETLTKEKREDQRCTTH